MSRNILCVIEFGNYPEQVVERATWMARSLDCNLHLLVCDPVTDYLGNSYVYLFESQRIAETIRQSQDEALEEMVAKVKAAGVTAEVNRSTERNAANVIRREATARQPRYVVKGTHFHTPSERARLTYEDWELIRDLEYPLWIVKPVEWRKPSVIVAAVDPVHAHDKPAHLDHGYAVTSHSAQGATADRVIVHAEGGQSAAVVNERFAYVAGSRMRDGLDVYTDNSQQLTSSLARQFDKTAAVHDHGIGARQDVAASGNSKGEAVSTGHAPQQGHSAPASSATHELGQGR